MDGFAQDPARPVIVLASTNRLDDLDPADQAAVEAVLAGDIAYDAASGEAQAVIRELWQARIDELRNGLDLADEFRLEGRTWVEADDDGDTVWRT